MADGANVNVNRRGAGAPNYAESKALDAMELLFCTVSEMEQGALAIYIVGTWAEQSRAEQARLILWGPFISVTNLFV